MIFDLDGQYVGADSEDGYDEVTVICEGALEAISHWTDSTNFQAFLDYWDAESAREGVDIEIFVLSHGHPVDIGECVCAQFETDHRPDYVFGNVA